MIIAQFVHIGAYMEPISTDSLSFRPVLDDIRHYSWVKVRHDLVAALSVVLLAFPQAMAYALLAGLPMSCGLIAAVFATATGSLFGSSRHLIVGPNNAIAILTAAGIAEVLNTHYRGLDPGALMGVTLLIMTQLTLLIGLFQLLVAWAKLGRFTQFVSHSVVVGYIAGVAMVLMVKQAYVFLGIAKPVGVSSLFHQAGYLFTHLNALHGATALIGILSLLLMLVLRKSWLRHAAPVIMLAGAGGVLYWWQDSLWLSSVPTIGSAGGLSDIYFGFQLPHFTMETMNTLVPIAFAIALLGTLEVTSVAKSIAASSGQRLSKNQEILGLGLANLVSAFTGGMPSSASPSRSALNYESGGLTRFAGVFNAGLLALTVVLLGGLVTPIPLTALSALLLITATTMVNREQLYLCLRATNSDAIVLITTMLSCLFFSLDIAFYIGIFCSITLYIKKASRPNVKQYVLHPSGELRSPNLFEKPMLKKIRVVYIEGELFFGAADLFQTTLKAIAEDDEEPGVIVLCLTSARDLDATSCLAIKQLDGYLKNSGRHFLMCGLKYSVWQVLGQAGLVSLIGKENLFIYDEIYPNLTLLRSLKRASDLVGQPFDFSFGEHEPTLPHRLGMENTKITSHSFI